MIYCPRCDVTDDRWRRVHPRRVMVDGQRRRLLQHACGEIVAVPLKAEMKKGAA